MGLSAEAYARQLKQLLPRGLVWNLAPDSWLSKLLLGLADELARIDARGDDLVDEWDPSTALETLPDWERALGLPDGCLPGSGATLPERQAAVVAKYVGRGGSTAAYFLDLAARLGVIATIEEPAPHTWRMRVDLTESTFTITYYTFRTGTARAGDRLSDVNAIGFECYMNRVKPAHTVLLYVYE